MNRIPSFCLLLALANPLAAASLELQAVPGTLRPGIAPRFALAGSWDGPCPPKVAGQRAAGRDLAIELEAADEGCGDAPAASFRLTSASGWDGQAEFDTPGVLRVRVERRRPDGAPQLLAFRLFEYGKLTRRLPEAGFWWSERGGAFETGGPGLALLLEPQWPQLGATVMGYDADGQPEWLFGAGTLAAHTAHVPLQRLSGGRGPFDGYRQPQASQDEAALWLELGSAARATAWFVRDADGGGIELRPMSLVRFRFGESASTALGGRWLLDGLEEAPRALQLRPADGPATATAFVLIEDRLALRLECSLDPGRPNSPPTHCRLFDAEGVARVQFDDIGLDRMHGLDDSGRPVTALRLPR